MNQSGRDALSRALISFAALLTTDSLSPGLDGFELKSRNLTSRPSTKRRTRDSRYEANGPVRPVTTSTPSSCSKSYRRVRTMDRVTNTDSSSITHEVCTERNQEKAAKAIQTRASTGLTRSPARPMTPTVTEQTTPTLWACLSSKRFSKVAKSSSLTVNTIFADCCKRIPTAAQVMSVAAASARVPCQWSVRSARGSVQPQSRSGVPLRRSGPIASDSRVSPSFAFPSIVETKANHR